MSKSHLYRLAVLVVFLFLLSGALVMIFRPSVFNFEPLAGYSIVKQEEYKEKSDPYTAHEDPELIKWTLWGKKDDKEKSVVVEESYLWKPIFAWTSHEGQAFDEMTVKAKAEQSIKFTQNAKEEISTELGISGDGADIKVGHSIAMNLEVSLGRNESFEITKKYDKRAGEESKKWQLKIWHKHKKIEVKYVNGNLLRIMEFYDPIEGFYYDSLKKIPVTSAEAYIR